MTSTPPSAPDTPAPSPFASAAPLRQHRPLRLPPPQGYPCRTTDGVSPRLQRYQGGPKGPVLLAHAFGTSSLLYLLDTIDTNVTEYLVAQGYDVWVWDYRTSPALPSASALWSLDAIATLDYPAAVQTVLAVTHAPSVQVVAHCVGAMTLLMALCAGLHGVRSAVCSQLSAHPVVVPAIRGKSLAHLPTMLRACGVTRLSPLASLGRQLRPRLPHSHVDHAWRWLSRLQRCGVRLESGGALLARLIDAAITHQPSREPCEDPVCQRILFLYGEAYKHAQLNEPTHRAVPDMFGVANLRAFAHLARILRVGHIVDQHGHNVYLPRGQRLALPLTFLHGAENRQFLPDTTARTCQWLGEHHGRQWYTRRVIPQYGHMDCLVGKHAAVDVFPLLLEGLEDGDRQSALRS